MQPASTKLDTRWYYERVPSPARVAAFDILMRVEKGAYASELLLHGLKSLDSRDAGLAEEIVFGVLRRRAQLDFLALQQVRRGLTALDPEVLIALRLGLYQLRHLDRVPAHAAVDESVELVKRARKRSAAGLVNAVLRKSSRGEVDWPSRDIALSMPAWLLDRWDRQFGSDVATGIASTFLEIPEIYLRNPPPDAPLELESTDVSGAFRVLSGSPAGLRIQDVGSQAVVPLLELSAGQSFLDLCAAPGNKTSQALESGVAAIACDRHLHRLRFVSGCPRVVLDAAEPLPFRGDFDRILVDAPCSGTGTLGRNPEIRWKLQPADIVELHAKQVRILTEALRALRPGGR
ncbi:MAG TPA: transcription antitermination factor NusB, partial [Bryobacteraceae bacterium]|nr:transcription antitermination factor NusB [Bryobacteraceae bacterium]